MAGTRFWYETPPTDEQVAETLKLKLGIRITNFNDLLTLTEPSPEEVRSVEEAEEGSNA